MARRSALVMAWLPVTPRNCVARSMKALVLTVLHNTSANPVLPPLAKKSLTLCLDQRVSTSYLELLNLNVIAAHNATKTELLKAEVNMFGNTVIS